jgi:RHS repeat-associated protein
VCGCSAWAYDNRGTSHADSVPARHHLATANLDGGEYFHYTYDIANRLTSVDGIAYAWDAKGNLLSDGERTYTYDHANRLSQVVMGADAYAFAYNGLGDRLRQTINAVPQNYTLDIVSGLTQVLADETDAYLYGVGRIGQEGGGGWQYHLGDALASVRQVSGAAGPVGYAQAFEPYGSRLGAAGANPTSYGFTGEWIDAMGLMHLRARYYASSSGRMLSRDPRPAVPLFPVSLNRWTYAYANPERFTDPSGMFAVELEQVESQSNSAKRYDVWREVATGPPTQGLGIQAAFLAAGLSSGHCSYPLPPTMTEDLIDELKAELSRYGVSLGLWPVSGQDTPEWHIHDLLIVRDAVVRVASALNRSIDRHWLVAMAPIPPPEHIFETIFGGLTIYRGPYRPTGWWAAASLDGASIRLYGPESIYTTNSRSGLELVVHELGHVFDFRYDEAPSDWVRGTFFSEGRTYTTIVAGLGVTKSTADSEGEAWADAFASWALNDYQIGSEYGSLAVSQAPIWRSKSSTYISHITSEIVYNWQVAVYAKFHRVTPW